MHYITLLVKFITVYWQPFFLISFILLIIYLLKWPLVRDVKINIFTYIGALVYISFYILFFIGLRWVQINKEIDMKKFTDGMENFLYLYNKSFFNQVFYTLLISLVVLLWVYIFIKLREKLSYQTWKVYLYYRYKYIFKKWNEILTTQWFETPKILTIFNEKLSFYKLSHKLNLNLIKIARAINFLHIAVFLNNVNHLRRIIRILSILLLFVFFLYDCYFNNFVLSAIKYYLFFYMIFSLWYKISTFFRFDDDYLNLILFEITYCAPNVVYINLTEEDEQILQNYLKDIKFAKNELFLLTYINDLPSVLQKNRFIYKPVNDILDISENGYNHIPYKYVYQNTNTQRYFPPEWLKEKDGKYYTDQEL